MAYMRQIAAELDTDAAEKAAASSGCFLCDAFKTDIASDTAQMRGVLHVGLHNVILLNRYPYTNGHLLIAPSGHVSSLGDMSQDARAEMMELTEATERMLRQAMHCQGVNVGMNLGRCAGAGVPGHLHMHVVPRWEGDTNFMQTIGGVRVQPQALDQSYMHLRQALQKML
jgi:ATP adenylyltransferase